MFHHLGECFFLGQVSFNFLGIGVVIREGCVNLSETEVPVLRRNLFRSQAHFVPTCDTHNGYSGAGNLGPPTADRGVAVDQATDLDGTNNRSSIAKWW